jgi:two-component system chemotaxis response regulator CheB
MPAVPRPIIVAAASSGGLHALSTILGHLPADFPGTFVVVQHRSPTGQSVLIPILQKRTALTVKQAQSGEPLAPGTVYVARADKHLSVGPDGRFHYSNGQRIRHLLSSANPLFESAAEHFGRRVIGVVLTGADSDGTDGVQAVKQYGGIVIAQDRATSEQFGMPRAAIATGAVDRVLPLNDIGPTLLRIARRHH